MSFWGEEEEQHHWGNASDGEWDDYGSHNRGEDDLQVKEIAVVKQKKSKKQKKRQEEEDYASEGDDQAPVVQRSKYEEDEEGFKKLKTKEQPKQQEKKVAQSTNTVTSERKGKKAVDNRKVIQNVLADVDDPFDYLAKQSSKESMKVAAKQRAEHRRNVKHSQPAKTATVQSKAEKQGKISNITKLEFAQSTKPQKKKAEKPKQPKQSAAAQTFESIASEISADALQQLIKKAQSNYPSDQYLQLKEVAGWFELQFIPINMKEEVTESHVQKLKEEVNKVLLKWLRSFNSSLLVEVFKFGLSTIYSDKGTPVQPGKNIGLKLFLLEVINAKPKAAADAIIACTAQFPQQGSSLKSLRYLLSQLLSRSKLQGTRAAISVTLTQLYGASSLKLKPAEQDEIVNYLNGLLSDSKLKQESGSDGSSGLSTLVDAPLFVALQKQVFSSNKTAGLEKLYKNLVPLSVFFSSSAPALFFEPELALLKNPKTSEQMKKEISSILLKGLKQGNEKCIEAWVRVIKKHVQATTLLLQYINEHGGLQGVKGVEKVTEELNRVAENEKIDGGMLEQLRTQTETLKRKNAEGSMLGFIMKLVLLVLLLVGATYVANIVLCEGESSTMKSSGFCEQTRWLTRVVTDLQKRSL